MKPSISSKELTRRGFIKTTGLATGAALIGGAHLMTSSDLAAPAIVKGTKLHLLQWNSFIPQAEDEIKRQAAEWGKQMGGSSNH